MHSLYLNEYKVGCKLLTEPFKMVITFQIQNISHAEKFNRTRGHARFVRIPLVVRLGDSRICLGDSGYGEVLSSGWHYNIFGFAFKSAHIDAVMK